MADDPGRAPVGGGSPNTPHREGVRWAIRAAILYLRRMTDQKAHHRFLRLLSEEAPPEAYERAFAEAEADGMNGTELQRLRTEMTTALQIRTTLQERHRREVELAALNETASDLASIRDVGRVLQAIVHRARHLLGTDTTYLTLIDEEHGDTYMRVTEGITQQAFKDLRLTLGTGLGGLVAERRSPYASPNYPSDERFAHTPIIDDAVGAEGLIAILGVPILLGDVVIGVLFAANRHERPFSPNEITLLSSLAAHAAVAIENARLFQEAENALRELERANAIISEHSAAVQRAEEAHERLTQLVLQGGGVDDVAAALAEILGGEIIVVDPEGHVIAGAPKNPAASGAPAGMLLEEAAAQALAAAQQGGRSVASAAGDSTPGARATPIVAGPEHLGALVLLETNIARDADVRILERAAQVTALLLLNQRSVAETEHRLRGEFVGDLLAETSSDPERMHRLAHLLGADLDQPQTVIAASVPDATRHQAWSAAGTLAAGAGGLAGSQDGNVVLIVPSADAAGAAANLARSLAANLGVKVTAGAAGPVAGLGSIRAAYQDAEHCLQMLIGLGRVGETATYDELGAYGLLFSHAGQDSIEKFVHYAIGSVLDYDAVRQTDLTKTLSAYFEQGGNVTRSAKVLHIHPNTLYQRLGRIGELLGEDWQNPDHALQLHLALKIHHLRTPGR